MPSDICRSRLFMDTSIAAAAASAQSSSDARLQTELPAPCRRRRRRGRAAAGGQAQGKYSSWQQLANQVTGRSVIPFVRPTTRSTGAARATNTERMTHYRHYHAVQHFLLSLTSRTFTRFTYRDAVHMCVSYQYFEHAQNIDMKHAYSAWNSLVWTLLVSQRYSCVYGFTRIPPKIFRSLPTNDFNV